MDAKPQRPFKAFAFRDENAMPLLQPTKTLHSRNKSSPALSTLAKSQKPSGGVSLAPRRTVFADLSNTSRFSHAVKDDSVVTSKHQLQPVKEICNEPMVKTSAAFDKPAQRPLSVAGLRSLFNSLGNNHNNPTTVEPIVTNNSQNNVGNPLVSNRVPEHIEQPIPRKALAKKPTLVFREPDTLQPSSVETIPKPKQELSFLPTVIETNDNNVAVAPEPQPSDVVPPLVEAQLSLVTASTSPDHSLPTDGVAIALADSIAQVSIDPEPRSDSAEVYLDAPDQPLQPELFDHMQSPPVDPLLINKEGIRPELEVQEHGPWDYYDPLYEQDLQYDHAGFTDHSYLTKGGYTTGAITTIVAPRVTSQAEEEIAAAKTVVAVSRENIELEEDEAWDPSMVAEYGEEIFRYMHKMEEKMRPNPYYMDNQTEIQWSMRSVLMDWLVQVHHRFSLLPETLFLCVNYIDRFLSCKVVSLGKLQLVGATAIFVAAKYEEINCPSIQEIVYMVDNGYTVDEILKAERFMLSMLQFELGWPGPMSFLRRVSKADDYDLETRTLAKYFLEVTIMDERFVGCIPSYGAAGAHCLARLMLQKGDWSSRHIHYSGYTYAQLRPLLQAMLSCCDEPQKHHAAIFDKYSDKRFKRASHFVQSELRKGFLLPKVKRPSMLEYNI